MHICVWKKLEKVLENPGKDIAFVVTNCVNLGNVRRLRHVIMCLTVADVTCCVVSLPSVEHGEHEVCMALVDVIVKDEQIDNTELHDAPTNLHAPCGSRQLVHNDFTEKVPLLTS